MWLRRLIVKLFQHTWGWYLRTKRKIKLVGEVPQTKGPALILANHVTFLDPVLLQLYFDEPIVYVAGNGLFRTKLLGRIVLWWGIITKSKVKADIQTAKGIIRHIKNGRVVGIFPEGMRVWDGQTKPFYFSTAKLIKTLKVPVIGCLIKGAYLTKARWARELGVGGMEMEYKTLLTADQIDQMSAEQIHQSIQTQLQHNEFDYNKRRRFKFKQKRRAEWLETMLFMCPNCQTINTLESHKELLTCRACHYQVRLNPYFEFEQVSPHPLHHTNLLEWNQWQMDTLKQHPQKIEGLIDDQVELFQQDKNLDEFHVIRLGQGTLSFVNQQFVFHSPIHHQVFDFEKMIGINVWAVNVLEFYYDDLLYRFTYHNKHLSAYKWEVLSYINGGVNLHG